MEQKYYLAILIKLKGWYQHRQSIFESFYFSKWYKLQADFKENCEKSLRLIWSILLIGNMASSEEIGKSTKCLILISVSYLLTQQYNMGKFA